MNIEPFHLLEIFIDFVGSLLVAFYFLTGLWTFFNKKSILELRHHVADGALAGLNFKVAGTLLKTIELHSWRQIYIFASIFFIRFVLKFDFSFLQREMAFAEPNV